MRRATPWTRSVVKFHVPAGRRSVLVILPPSLFE
jgi:hypothetical protein